MNFFRTSDPDKIVKEFYELLEKEELPSKQEIIGKSNLSEDEVAIFAQYENRILPVVVKQHHAWTLLIPPYENKLKTTLEKLVLLHSDKVVGNQEVFIAKLFSKSNDFHIRKIPGGVTFGIKSSEPFDSMFELDVFADIYDQATKIELEPKLVSGKCSEFKVFTTRGFLHIEAKCINSAKVYENIYGSHGSLDFVQSKDNQRELRETLKKQITNARKKFRNSNEPYAIFIDPILPISLYGDKTAVFLDRKKAEGFKDKNLEYIAIRDIEGYNLIRNITP